MRAAVAGAKGLNHQAVQAVAHDNALLEASKVLAHRWLSALTSPESVAGWTTAVSQWAPPLISAAGAACVVGGLGVHAAQLALAVQQLGRVAHGDGETAPQVISCEDGQLGATLLEQIAVSNDVRQMMSHAPDLQSAIAMATQATGGLVMLVCPDACTAQLRLRHLQRILAQCTAAGADLHRAVICPQRVVVKGVLIDSTAHMAVNSVDLQHMHEDTGLDYGPCNELLWCKARSLQVDLLPYRTLSAPVTLLDTHAHELAPYRSTAPPEEGAPRIEAAGAGPVGAGWQPRQPERTWHITVPVTCAGHVHAMITWCEVELAPGVWLSHAPRGTGQEGADVAHPVLRPHVWQRVHYCSLQPRVRPGQQLGFEVRLTPGARPNTDEVQLQLDETTLAHPLPRASCAARANGATGPDAGGPMVCEDGGSNDGQAYDLDLPAGEPLTPDADSAEDSVCGDNAAEGACAAAPRSLTYHLSMLNDRARTCAYRDGIAEAVRAMLSQGTSSMDGDRDAAPHPVVLDVGAGTGLLSMLAAQAGAPVVVGIERELPLAMAATTLAETNGLHNAVTILHTTIADVALLPECDTSGTGPRGAAGLPGGVLLPQPPALVVHEIFGSDPLSEQILTTMRHVKMRLAGPRTVFMPGRFRVVAALAHTPQLRAAWYDARLQLPGSSSASDAHAGGCSVEQGGGNGRSADGAAARLPRLDVLQPWASPRVECDLTSVPDCLLLTHPTPVLTFDLNAGPDPLPPHGAARATLTPCAPTPVAEYARTGVCRGPTDHVTPPGGSYPAATCAVYWFEVDCGAGGWLSTGPGHTPACGAWQQCVDFAAVGQDGARGTAGLPAGVSVRAEWVVDRVRLRVVDPTESAVCPDTAA